MTIIQSQKNDIILHFILVILVGALIAAGAMLVFLYNHTVNLQHSISDMSNEIKKIQTENAELQENIYASFSTARVEAFAAEHGLVKDKTPYYLKIDPRWFLASRY